MFCQSCYCFVGVCTCVVGRYRKFVHVGLFMTAACQMYKARIINYGRVDGPNPL